MQGKNAILHLIEQLQRFDNKKGYGMEYKAVKKELSPIIGSIIDEGEAILEELHNLLGHEETWSCLFALEILKEIKSEKSIPYLIEFIKDNEDGNYFESCDEAIFALKAIGKPAIKPLLDEVKAEFEEEYYPGYLTEALTSIKDEEVYNFMVSVSENYLKNSEKYQDWLSIDEFTYGFENQGKKEVLPLLKKIRNKANLSRQELIELDSTIEVIEDPEGYKKRMDLFLESISKQMEQDDEGKEKLGRNEPCHCGSGIKYKKCCLDGDIKKYGHAIKI